MKRAGQQPGKGALDLLEEAAHLVRTAPAGTLAAYYVGALPFVLGGLYFWADMSRSPYAAQHLAGATLGMGGLFVWMKYWQTVFARRVRACLAGEALPRFSWRRCGRLLMTQMALQPAGLFVLPLASVPVLPLGWVYAFYQNLTVLDDGESGELRPLLRQARRQAALWPKQNHLLLGLLLGFGVCVFLNWAMVCFALPGLVKMLFGVESIFTRATSFQMLNTTFFAATFGLTYLCVDPIAKAAYALRCFYGESVQSGEDLKSGLREFVRTAEAVAVGVLVMVAVVGACRGADAAVVQAGKTAEAQSMAAPEGSLRIAQRFSVGSGCPAPKSPEGTAEKAPGFSRPFGTRCPPRSFPNAEALGYSQLCLRHRAAHAIPELYRYPCSLEEGRVRGIVSLEDWNWAGAVAAASADGDSTSLKRGANERSVGHAESRTGEIATSVSAPKLDATIERVIQENKYAWRAPRDKGLSSADADEGILGRFLMRVWELVKKAVKAVFHGLGKCLEWLGKWLDKLFGRFFRLPAPNVPGYGWIMSLNLLLYVLVAGVILGLLYLAYRIWRNRRSPTAVIASEPILPVPDVADENVGADQLPEEGWMKLARELLGRGELRLALRAFYLASLAHLAERNLISIAKSKSNREYERELLRRGHSFPGLLAVFGENVTVFDRIWYGLHEVNLDLVNDFAARVEQIKGVAAGHQSAGGGA